MWQKFIVILSPAGENLGSVFEHVVLASFLVFYISRHTVIHSSNSTLLTSGFDIRFIRSQVPLEQIIS